MKYFKTKKIKRKNKLLIIIISIITLDLIIFYSFNSSLNKTIINLAEIKIEELTRFYINNTLKKYLNVDTNNYIKLNIVNNNIIDVDINNSEANKLLKSFLIDLEKNLSDLSKGKLNKYNNVDFIYGNNGIIFLIPFGLAYNTTLLSGIGPKIPIKVSFLESLETYIDVTLENYGLNNSIIKLYLIVNIQEIVDITNDKKNINYKFLLDSKIIKGEVPSFYGEVLSKSSNIVN